MQPNPYYQMQYPCPCMAGDFIYVQGEQMARNYPVTPGHTVRFMDVSRPYSYYKTGGLSPQDTGTFVRVRMEIEPDPEPATINAPAIDPANLVTKEQFDALNGKIDKLINSLPNKENHKNGGMRNERNNRDE